MSNVTDLKKQWLKDPEFKTAYESMANRMDAKQSLVARIESGDKDITVKTLSRVAEAMGTNLKITFER